MDGDKLVSFNFRCTFCNKLISWYLTREILSIPAEEDPQPGKMYRYDRCYCGFGRFVMCERRQMTPEESERAIHQQMRH